MLHHGDRGEQRLELRDEQEGNGHKADAGHELLDALALCAGVVVAVAFHQMDQAHDADAGADQDHDGLQYVDCSVEKCHDIFESSLQSVGR